MSSIPVVTMTTLKPCWPFSAQLMCSLCTTELDTTGLCYVDYMGTNIEEEKSILYLCPDCKDLIDFYRQPHWASKLAPIASKLGPTG